VATAETEAGPQTPELSYADVPAGMSWPQVRWARSWGLTFVGPEDDSFYAAVLAATGGALPGGESVGQVNEFRRLLSLRMTNDRPHGGLGDWPAVAEVYAAEVRARVLRMRTAEGLPGLTADEDQRLRADIEAQVDDGRAWDQIVAGVLEPSHWPELGRGLAPLLVSRYFGIGVLTVGPDGAIGAYGSGRPVIVAEAAGTDSPSWAAVVPTDQEDAPLAGLSAPQLKRAYDET
jgi:hypothetical protein